MRYLGGKTRLASTLAPVIMSIIEQHGCTIYSEPFVGSAAVVEKLSDLGLNNRMILSDSSEDLILLYRALRGGWIPPADITEEQYKRERDNQPSALRGFVGYGCSWGGKFFGGYARGEDRNYAAESQRSLLRTISKLSQASFWCLDYSLLHFSQNSFIYCDPPYANTTKYSGEFDHDRFWSWARRMTKVGHAVAVSEYTAPSDFVCIWAKQHYLSVRSHNVSMETTEKLFVHESIAP